jgi:hypothetical protein
MPTQRIPSISNILILLILAAGLFLRVWQYLHSGSFWLDEAWLANNVVQHLLAALLAEPLDSHRGAPLAFLFVAKNFSLIFGQTDSTLRITPLIFGVLRACFLNQIRDKQPDSGLNV